MPDGSVKRELSDLEGNSLLPNPTNGVVSNDTIIYPDPSNQAYRDYLTRQAKLINMESGFVDTWRPSHSLEGNLHCSSQALRYCRPRK